MDKSCRILERKVSFFIQIVNIAKINKIKTVTGEFIKTNKNKIVEDHYKKLYKFMIFLINYK